MGTPVIKSKVIVVKSGTDYSSIRDLENTVAEGYKIADSTAMFVAKGDGHSSEVGPVIYTLRHTEVRF